MISMIQECANELALAIDKREFGVGDKLSPLYHKKRFGVSDETLRRALLALVDVGIVKKVKRSYFVERMPVSEDEEKLIKYFAPVLTQEQMTIPEEVEKKTPTSNGNDGRYALATASSTADANAHMREHKKHFATANDQFAMIADLRERLGVLEEKVRFDQTIKKYEDFSGEVTEVICGMNDKLELIIKAIPKSAESPIKKTKEKQQ